jgi:hypothetical protein
MERILAGDPSRRFVTGGPGPLGRVESVISMIGVPALRVTVADATQV